MHLDSLTLKHFILKQRVLDLYRHAIRASRCERWLDHYTTVIEFFLAIPDSTARREAVSFIRSEFERNRFINDPVRVLWSLVLLGAHPSESDPN